jgi:arylsulfatase
VIDQPVELMDVMPTILDIAGITIPDTVEGSSVLPLMTGEDTSWREFVHGEIWRVAETSSGMHYLTDGKRKYIWFPAESREQYFNLEDDPHECHDLADDRHYQAEIATWRQHLVKELADRPEEFTDGEELLPLDGPTAIVLPGFERGTDLFQEGIE